MRGFVISDVHNVYLCTELHTRTTYNSMYVANVVTMFLQYTAQQVLLDEGQLYPYARPYDIIKTYYVYGLFFNE